MADEIRLHLARKYRPSTFSDMVGQELVLKNLRESLRQDRLAPAYLFSGPRGTGKTTAARIFARAAACLSNDLASRPCDECASCKAHLSGRSMDLIEMDGASHTGVDDARSIIETVAFRPSLGKRLVIIIDEVHMLSTSAFNALLKTLEEPPSHALFLFATTEPEKIPDTIISRVQRLQLLRLADKVIVARLKDIAAKEGLVVSEAILKQIAGSADGALRDAVTLLEQSLLLSGKKEIDEKWVTQFLGSIGSDQELLLMQHLADTKSNPKAVESLLESVGSLYAQGKDLALLLERLILWSRSLLVAKGTGSLRLASQDLEEEDIKKCLHYFETWSFDECDALFETLWQGLERLKKSPLSRVALETTFLRASRIGSMMTPHHATSVPPAPAIQPKAAASAVATSPRIQSTPAPATAPTPAAAAPRSATDSSLSQLDDWLLQIKKKRPTLHALILSASKRELSSQKISLSYSPGHFAYRQLSAPANKGELENLFRVISGTPDYSVELLEFDEGRSTPPNTAPHFMRSAQKFALEDAAVKRAQEILKGKVDSVVISGVRSEWPSS